MKGAFVVCEELRSLDGVLGAFVLEHERCVASSCSPEFDATRFEKLGTTLARARQVIGSHGYDGASLVLHWERGSLMVWPARDGSMLGLLAAPDVGRETLEERASVALSELASVKAKALREFTSDELPTRPDHGIPRPRG
jgi:hypothetical protein